MMNQKRINLNIFRLSPAVLVGFLLLGIVLISQQSRPVQARADAASPEAPSAVNAATFTKSDSLVNDVLGNGMANPGDTIQYTMVISNATTADMTNVILSDTLDSNVTMVPNSLSTSAIAFDGTAVTTESSPATITLTGSDPDGDSLAFAIVSGPANGALGAIMPQTATSATVTYTPNGGFTGSDSFIFQVADDNSHTDSATINITVNPAVNNPPVLDLDANDSSGAGGANYNTAFVEDGGAVPVSDTDVSVTDDGGSLVTAVFTLTNHPDGSDESLSVNGALPGGLAASIDASGHAITLTGSTTPANYQTAIRQIEYNNLSNTPTETNRTVTVVVNDGVNDSNTAVATITVTAANDAPALDLDADDSSGATGGNVNVSFTEGAGAIALNSGIAITDVDNTDLVSGTVTLTNPLDGTLESLAINSGLATGFGITAVFGADNQSIALSGSATLDEYRQVLETVTYNNTDNNPDATTRAVTFVVNDGSDDSNTATANIAITPFNDPPGATDDNFNTAVGNTLFAVGITPPGPVVTATGSVLDNDTDPEMGTLTAVAISNGSTTNGGTVNLSTDGTFSYLPPLGFEGADSFTYTVTDGSLSQNATVNLTVTDVVWYIDNTAAGGGDGRSATPFNTLAAFNTAQANAGANDPEAGDIIFIYEGTGDSTNLNVGISLMDDQQLIGQGVDLVVGAHTLVSASGNPTVTNPGGAGVTLAQNNIIRGLDIGDTSGSGLFASASFGTLTMNNASIVGQGRAINFNGAGTVTMNLERISSQGGFNGIIMASVGGTITVNSSTIISSTTGGSAIWIANGPAGTNFDFGATTILGSGANGLELSNNTGTFTFDSLNITTSAGSGIIASNSGTININSTAATVNATGGPAVNISGTAGQTNGGSGWTFASLSSTNSPAEGIRLVNLSDNFTVPGGSISGAAGVAVDIDQGGTAVTYGGSITNTAGRSVEVTNRTGGTVNLSGFINDDGTGIFLNNNTGSTLTFSGGMALDTGSNTAFTATGGGTVNVTGSNNTIGATTPVTAGAVNINNTTIGGSGVTFLSISANGGDTGITLNNTSAGSFTVTGSGATDGSGGTLQNHNDHGIELISTQNVAISNMNLINAALTQEVAPNTATCTDEPSGTNTGCNAPVQMVNASSISLTNLTINGSVQHGINGNNVTGLTISNTDVSNIGNQLKENGLHFINLLGTSSFNNVSVLGSYTRNVLIENNRGTAVINLTDSTINTAQNEDGFFVIGGSNGGNNANITLNVTDSSFTNNKAGQLKAHAEDNSTVDANFTGNDFAGQPTVVGDFGIDLAVRDGGTLTFDVTGTGGNPQTFQPMRSHAINVFASGGGTASGRITGNTILGSEVGAGVRAVAQVTDVNGFNPSITVEINNNTISNVKGAGLAGIHVESRDGTTGLTGTANVQATLNNNSVSIDGADSVIQARANSGNTLCLDVTNNSASGAATSPFAPLGSTHYIGNPLPGDTLGAGNVTYDGYITNDLGNTWNNNGNTPTLAAGISGEAFVDGTQPTNGTCATPAALPNRVSDLAATPLATAADANVNIGTLPAGKAMTVMFAVTINDLFPNGVTQISNQAQLSADALGVMLSDDPDTGAVDDATVTAVTQILTTYLPVIMNNFNPLPDLVVNAINVSAGGISVEIENVGSAAAVDGFWVDMYINPSPPPTAVNQTWPMLADEGLVWGVTSTLDPGETLTLTLGDAYYQPGLSNFSGSIAAGTPVYVQVDSANTATTYGAVLETHEFYNTAYNNIGSTTATALASLADSGGEETAVTSANLPLRP